MKMEDSKSFLIAKEFLGKKVDIVIDRPIGSKHPKYENIYPVNYGYVPGVIMPDGEDLDVYFLGIDGPVEKINGICIAIIHRLDNDDDKLIVVPENFNITNEEIEKLIDFQEKYFKHIIIG